MADGIAVWPTVPGTCQVRPGSGVPGRLADAIPAQVISLAVTTGWIEAPASGSYVFELSQQPSRLFVNGTSVLDWFETSPGTTSGSITLAAGQRYHLRWDRIQAEPPSGTPGPGLTWQVPGTVGQAAIPSGNLYEVAPGSGTGLTATYFTGTGFGGASTTRTDAYVDINTDIAPPGTTPHRLRPVTVRPTPRAGKAKWFLRSARTTASTLSAAAAPSLFIDGAAVTFPGPPASSAPGGCAHDLCTLGSKLDASCNGCVHDICDKDPYCCDGGYLSYYSVEPEWDARCIAEVATYCPGFSCAPPPPPAGVSPQTKSVAVR